MNPDKQLTEIGKEAVRQIAKPVQDFISAVVGAPAKELGGWISDGIRDRRLETQITIYTKAQKLTKQLSINPKAINMKLLVPLLENGSLEDDEKIIDMWSHLLANAAFSNEVRSSYIDILKQLEPIEARIMQYIFNAVQKQGTIGKLPAGEFVITINGKPIQERFDLSHDNFEQAIDNLYRLRLLAPSARRLTFIEGKEVPFANYTKETIGVTYFGYYFAKACNAIEDRNK